MPSPPTFFFSYAQGDAEDEPRNLVARFFSDLERRTALRAAADPRDANANLGTFDQRLKQGSDWKRRLAEALKTSHVFVPLLTPLYFKRPNCGRELAAFIKRFPKPYVDDDGSLRLPHAENILAIRWMDERAYTINGVPDVVVPALLRSVEWKPASDANDPQLEKAIKRYRRRGMEGCVNPGRAYYHLLLDSFADRMRGMPKLEPADFEPDLENGDDAFTADWLKARSAAVSSAVPVMEPMGPGALVAIYITNASLPLDPRPVKFVDNLVDETALTALSPGPLLPDGQRIQGMLAAVRFAAVLERLAVFHCACTVDNANAAARLTEQLKLLCERNVITVLVVDPTVWGGFAAPTAAPFEAVVMSDGWAGPVVVPLPEQEKRSKSIVAGFEQWRSTSSSVRPVTMLPPTPAAMIEALRAIVVAERGRVMKAGKLVVAPSGDKLPILKGVGGTTRKS
jgi:hypothetical protein